MTGAGIRRNLLYSMCSLSLFPCVPIGSVPCVRAFVSGLGPLGSLLLVKEF